MKQIKFVAAFLTAVAFTPAFGADVVGKIVLKGTPVPEKEIPLDVNCGPLWPTEKPKTRFYIVGPEGGLADVFVYLSKGAEGKGGEAPSTPAVLDQKRCEYLPHVMGLRTGQKLVIRNSDPVMHNVHAGSAVSANKEFNLAQVAGGKDLERTFDKEEVFLRFKCDVHPWMFAYAGVLSHPFFAVTDKEGNFKIANVPAGAYTLTVFHRKTHVAVNNAITKEITVGDQNLTENFEVVPAAAGAQ
jgi:hypothetical protein